ncbi:hypothetical protein OsJ_34111 [Oryza sativa Japonica Group]|uniref:Uncharacterized protein n=1 Tax=Oryza sativa subsp. japonica TaxID=39947 RepID=B9GB07_ORYSJ|nr:hypothetical protein OsJ_34111 [Oryza sativa Japonica Group]
MAADLALVYVVNATPDTADVTPAVARGLIVANREATADTVISRHAKSRHQECSFSHIGSNRQLMSY